MVVVGVSQGCDGVGGGGGGSELCTLYIVNCTPYKEQYIIDFAT